MSAERPTREEIEAIRCELARVPGFNPFPAWQVEKLLAEIDALMAEREEARAEADGWQRKAREYAREAVALRTENERMMRECAEPCAVDRAFPDRFSGFGWSCTGSNCCEKPKPSYETLSDWNRAQRAARGKGEGER